MSFNIKGGQTSFRCKVFTEIRILKLSKKIRQIERGDLGVPKSQPNKKSQDWDFSGKNLGIFWDFLGFFKNFQIN